MQATLNSIDMHTGGWYWVERLVSSRFFRKLLVVTLVMLLTVQVGVFWGATIDDAFISFRYSARWAQGQGITYNLNEQVEGYSNFLWVAMMAGAHRLGFDLVATAKVFGLVSLCAIFWLAVRAIAAAGYNRFAIRVAIGGLMIGNVTFIFLALGGMETTFFALLLMLILDRLALSGNMVTPVVALLLLALCFTRPEGVGYTALLMLALWWTQRKLARKTWLPWLLVWGGYAGYLLWRWHYYGAWLPNTFLAKPSPTDTMGIVGFVTSILVAGPAYTQFLTWSGGAFAVALAFYAAWNHKTRALFVPAVAMIAAGVLFQLYAATDWMNLGRFLAPIWAPFLVMAVCGWSLLSEKLQIRPARANTLLALWVIVTMAVNLNAGVKFAMERAKYPNFVLTSEDMIAASRWIAAHYPANFSIVCWRIGALGYYTDLTIIDDTWGLTDAHIAQLVYTGKLTEETRQDYLHQRNPELVMKRALGDAAPLPTVTAGKRSYTFVRRFPQGSEEWWDLYQRADLPSVVVNEEIG